MRSILLNLIVACVCVSPMNSQGNSEFIEDFLVKWSNAHEYTLQVADALPASQYDFKPTEDQRAFHEQITHLCANMIWLSTTYLDGNGLESANADEPPTDKEDIIELLNESFDYAHATISQLDPNTLDAELDFFAGPMSRRRVMLLMADHLAHHRGQAIVYLRLKSIDPPRYKGW